MAWHTIGDALNKTISMKEANSKKVLAIGLDAAPPGLVQELIDQGSLPVLARLRDDGKWLRVVSSADIGGGSVWATMMTGCDPETHGFYTGWPWNAESMSVTRATPDTLVPFWKDLAQGGVRVGVLDVPYSPLADLSDGFEIIGWGPRGVEAKVVARPAKIEDLLAKQFRPHPYYKEYLDPASPGHTQMLERVAAASINGATLRGDLAEALINASHPQFALIVFHETHFGGHHLWHLWEPNHPFYLQDEFPKSLPIARGLREIYQEVDRQIGRLVDAADENTAVLVFSLHGMQPSGGVAAMLGPFLCEQGYAQLATVKSWPQRAAGVFALAKKVAPRPLKRLYYRLMPGSATMFLARPNVVPPYDWARTRAFALPTEQHGWIRVNLKGREAEGIVSPDEYETLCRELEQLVRSMTDEAGQPLARAVIRSVARVEDAMKLPTPDLIINWEDAALFSPLRIKGSRVESRTVGQKFTGQHGLEGFGILRGPWSIDGCDTVFAKDLPDLFRRVLMH
jgi:predicted AlkP superfamily phosphohydrolase/phosphomutase